MARKNRNPDEGFEVVSEWRGVSGATYRLLADQHEKGRFRLDWINESGDRQMLPVRPGDLQALKIVLAWAPKEE